MISPNHLVRCNSASSPTRRRTRRQQRGFGLVEILAAVTISCLIFLMHAAIISSVTTTCERGEAEGAAKQTLYLATERMAPTLRSALRVETSKTNSKMITVVLPRTDGGGKIILPLADGDVVSYYLSDSTGSKEKNGNMLWCSVNGAPLDSWAKGSAGSSMKLDKGDGMKFELTPSAANAKSVVVSLAVSKSTSTGMVRRTVSTEIYFRNRGL